jgi:hypothetical protein
MLKVKLLFGLLGGFCVFSIVEIIWGYFTPGDYYANGCRWVVPSFWLASFVGFGSGWYGNNRIFRIVVAVISFAAIAYWVFVPDGWWAHEPH